MCIFSFYIIDKKEPYNISKYIVYSIIHIVRKWIVQMPKGILKMTLSLFTEQSIRNAPFELYRARFMPLRPVSIPRAVSARIVLKHDFSTQRQLWNEIVECYWIFFSLLSVHLFVNGVRA